jgi:preprotein translocase subunit YajC
MSLFIADAYAQTAQDALTGGGLSSLVPLVLIIAVFYVLIIRPQQKKMKEHEMLIKSLNRGDKIVTAGGILGSITRVDEAKDTFTVEIASGVQVEVKRGTVPEVISRTGAPSNDNGKAEKKKEKKEKKKA